MARRSEKNPYYRTKREMAEDIHQILKTTNITTAAKHAVIQEVMWLWTEFDGKYTGCPYWSSKAIQYLHETDTMKGKLLRHDHVVPRNLIIKELLKSESMSVEEIFNFLETCLIGAVLLKEEDDYLNTIGFQRSMPSSDWVSGGTMWKRYVLGQIKIFRVEWNKKIGAVKDEFNLE